LSNTESSFVNCNPECDGKLNYGCVLQMVSLLFIPVKTAGVPAEVWTWHLPSTSQQYNHSNGLGEFQGWRSDLVRPTALRLVCTQVTAFCFLSFADTFTPFFGNQGALRKSIIYTVNLLKVNKVMSERCW